jgi:hypothetical protein
MTTNRIHVHHEHKRDDSWGCLTRGSKLTEMSRNHCYLATALHIQLQN